MQSFKIPEFYMPCPARVNPHGEQARAHSKVWAHDMGMFCSSQNVDGYGIWDERTFDAADVGSLVALTHPDATAAELELLADWYVWLLYLHDSSQVFDGNDLAGARKYVKRLPAFMPMDVTAAPVEEPANPAERGLADLWPRTVPTRSAQWRHRFFEHILSQAEETVRERFHIAQDKNRVLDPIEYIDMRRQAGAWLWKADLVEHALGIEIPAELYKTRPIRVLNETFADSAHLRKDILSYQADVDQGKANNGVVVVRNFLDCDPQRAADIVNNFVTSRLYQFEDTFVTELFPLFEEYGTSFLARREVLTYVKGLQDWMAGNLEWVRPSGCQPEATTVDAAMLPWLPCGPTGLGTMTARVGLSREAMGLRLRSYQGVPYPAEPYELPQFYMPFPARENPHLDALRTHARAWAREMGLLGPLPDPRGPYGRWDEQKWDSGRFELLSVLLFPDAELAELELANDWYVWVFYMKDVFLECFKRRRDLLGARAFLSRLPLFASAEGTTTPVATNTVEHALADLWSRSVQVMPAGLRRPLAGFVADLARTLLMELTNLVRNRTPDPLDFEEMRRSISTATLADVLVFYTLGLENPPEIYRTSPLRSLTKAYEIVLSAYVDVFAYEQRVNWHHDFNTGVVVMQRFFDSCVQEAVDILNQLGASRLRQFEHTSAVELPVLFDELELDSSAREGVLAYVNGLEAFLAGWLEWLVRAVGSPGQVVGSNNNVKTASFTFLTGLGTSAARIVSLSGVGSPEPVASG